MKHQSSNLRLNSSKATVSKDRGLQPPSPALPSELSLMGLSSPATLHTVLPSCQCHVPCSSRCCAVRRACRVALWPVLLCSALEMPHLLRQRVACSYFWYIIGLIKDWVTQFSGAEKWNLCFLSSGCCFLVFSETHSFHVGNPPISQFLLLQACAQPGTLTFILSYSPTASLPAVPWAYM